jgi:hypothetical protein
MMSGTINRRWNKGVMRLASMEGVICAGAMTRVIAGPSATMSGLMTADIYGGIARAAVVRNYLAVLQYRAARTAAWAVGAYLRNATVVIEPLMGSPSGGAPVSNFGARMGRLGRIASKVRKGASATAAAAAMVCPVVDIGLAILSLPLVAVGIYALIKGFIVKPIPIPPTGPPRSRIRNVAMGSEMFTSQTFL